MSLFKRDQSPPPTPEQTDERMLAEGDARGESEWCALGSCALCTEAGCTCICHQ